MHDWKNGPASHLEAQRMAQESQRRAQAADTRNWDWNGKQTYFRNGGK